MKSKTRLTRRTFLSASTGALVAGGAVGHAEDAPPPATKLAVQGGPKAVPEAAPKLVRFGEPERERLNALVGQESLLYWKGPQTTLFIDRFRKVCPLTHVMTCSSGTASLHIAVAVAGIGPGDEVITSPITDIGTVIGVLFQQGVPVFADLGHSTYNLDPADVERRITPKTKAIIAVHLAGNPCDLEALRAIADKHKLILIEDCAQSWGTQYRGKPIGTFGHIACFSLQNTKQITCGDGGVVASSDSRFGPLLQKFGDKGSDRTGKGGGLFTILAPNYRMSEPQAAVAAAQIGKLQDIATKRAKLGGLLGEGITGAPGIEPHQIHPDDRCTYWFYMFRVQPKALKCDRATFIKALVAEGAPALAGYIPVPMYGNPVFKKHEFFAGRWPVKDLGLTTMDYGTVSCSEAEAMLKTGIRLPINEAMSEGYVRNLAAAVQKVARHYAA
jgi:perosamine synthetase